MTRVLLFTTIGGLLVVLMGSVQELLGMDLVVVDLPLIVVLYLVSSGRDAGRRGVVTRAPGQLGIGTDWTGGLVAITLGYFADVLGGGIKGLHTLALVIVFLLARRAARHVFLTGPVSTFLIAFVAAVVAGTVAVVVRWMAGVAPSFAVLTVILAQATVTAVAAPPLLRLFGFIDAKLTAERRERRPGLR